MDRKKFCHATCYNLSWPAFACPFSFLYRFDGPISSISFQWNWDQIARETMLACLVKRHLWSPMVHGGPLKFCSNTSESQEFHKGLQHLLQRIALLCFLACIVHAAPV
jgi:hypothetical protein